MVYSKNPDDKTHSVARNKPDARGLCDMPVNVREWCEGRIIDLCNQDWKSLIKKFHTVIQNYRMISLKGNIRLPSTFLPDL